MPTLSAYQIAYQKSPIVFVNGIANSLPQPTLPIISITQSSNFSSGVTGNAGASGNGQAGNNAAPPSGAILPEDYLFDFYPMAGSLLASFDIGRYPFANQQIAANAIIGEPLSLSVLMIADVRQAGGYDTKRAVFTALQAAIQRHATLGGTYSVSTPSYLYQGLILLSLQDSSSGDQQRPQNRWTWNFIQPLTTLLAAQAAQNSLMLRLSSSLTTLADVTGSVLWSSTLTATGNIGSGQSTPTIPAAQNIPGAGPGVPALLGGS
jgi:hypothetical protein